MDPTVQKPSARRISGRDACDIINLCERVSALWLSAWLVSSLHFVLFFALSIEDVEFSEIFNMNIYKVSIKAMLFVYIIQP